MRKTTLIFLLTFITALFIKVGHPVAAERTFIVKEFDFNFDGVLPSEDADTEYINNSSVGIPYHIISEAQAYSVSNGILSQRTMNGIGYAFYQSSENPGFDPSLDLIIEARFKIIDILDDRNTGFYVEDGVNIFAIYFESGGFKYWTYGGESDLITMNVDIGGSYHTYRLESKGGSNEFDFFVDGIKIHTGTAAPSTNNKWLFGDGSWGYDNDADVDWDYIRFMQISSECN